MQQMIQTAFLLLFCSFTAGFAAASEGYGTSKGNEELLIKGLESLTSKQFDAALVQLRELTEQRPDFRLAQLVYADLLAAQVNPLGQVGSDQSARQQEIQGLLDEAKARLISQKNKPWNNLIPASLIKMSDQQRYAIVVSAKYSRLFLFENRSGVPVLVKDYYASYGRGGTGKEKRGDLKTPLGVYFVTGRLLDKNLPERYGSGALPINYPNVWDNRLGKTGSGIWVHGSPVNTYSRPPKASEGCISLTNPDFLELDQLVDIANTPVVIGYEFNWLTHAQWLARQKQFVQRIDQWRTDWESRSHPQYMRNYSRSYQDNSRDYAAFENYKAQVNARKAFIKVDLANLSLFEYPDNADILVATFYQRYQSDNYQGSGIKRQYWIKDSRDWKIAYEGAPSAGLP